MTAETVDSATRWTPAKKAAWTEAHFADRRRPGRGCLEEVFGCDLAYASIWTHGWVDKRKFKGDLLSRYERRAFDADYEKADLIRGKVVYGWVLTVAGDLSGCGWDMTTYLLKDEPEIVDGRYASETTYEYDDEDNETEVNPEVVDGPHKATWLEIEGGRW